MKNPADVNINTMVDTWLENTPRIFSDLSKCELIDLVIERNEGFVTKNSSIIVRTGKYTGRSPLDKYIVQEKPGNDDIWWGRINHPLSVEKFLHILKKQLEYLKMKDIFIQNLGAGNPGSLYLPIRVITETAWHSLFAQNLLRSGRPNNHFYPEKSFTIIHSPFFEIEPVEAGIQSSVFIIINFSERLILIGGTAYAGEIKKSVFTILNYIFQKRGIFTIHCAANVGKMQDVALFFGLSGTGKTTLSSSPDRQLIGDDEHGWSDYGIFNLEGGCYAKTIHLSQENDPIIWKAVNQTGSVLENIPYDPSQDYIDFESDHYTENTRAAYPISNVSGIDQALIQGHPKTIFFLTADAFGILPPLSRLTYEQTIYHFLSGYTSKIAGTESGLGREPCATFSSCFSEPFLPLEPRIYADMLKRKLLEFNPNVWLVNTGWTAGPYGKGYRIRLEHTRAIIEAGLKNIYLENDFFEEPFFHLRIPRKVQGVPDQLLDPRNTWNNPSNYDQAALKLVQEFKRNYSKFE